VNNKYKQRIVNILDVSDTLAVFFNDFMGCWAVNDFPQLFMGMNSIDSHCATWIRGDWLNNE